MASQPFNRTDKNLASTLTRQAFYPFSPLLNADQSDLYLSAKMDPAFNVVDVREDTTNARSRYQPLIYDDKDISSGIQRRPDMVKESCSGRRRHEASPFHNNRSPFNFALEGVDEIEAAYNRHLTSLQLIALSIFLIEAILDLRQSQPAPVVDRNTKNGSTGAFFDHLTFKEKAQFRHDIECLQQPYFTSQLPIQSPV